MKILNLAWRNVFRHTRRTVITAAAISVGLASMIMMNTMMNGMDKMAARNIIDYETGHIEVFAKGYYREEGFFPLDTIVEDPGTLTGKIGSMRGVSAVVPRVKFQASITDGIDELPVLGVGVDIARESSVFDTPEATVEGRFLAQSGDVLIGVGLAKDMGLEIGSFLTLVTKDRNGTYNARDLVVAGLLNTGHPLFDRNAAVIALKEAQELLAMGSGVTELSIRARNENDLTPLKRELANVIGEEHESYTWREMNASVFEISGFKRAAQFMVALIVVIISAIGIVNTMLMAVMERIPEIGTLKAMGFRKSGIMKMFMYEGGIIGIFGSLLGCVLGLLTSFYLVYIGIDISSVFQDMDIGYPIRMIIKGEIDPWMVLYVFLFGVLVALAVTLWPVRKAAQLEPVDALRHV